MTTKNDQLEVLKQMRIEGRISEDEYAALTGDAPEAEPAQAEDLGPDRHEGANDAESQPAGDARPLLPPVLRADLAARYTAMLAFACLGLVLASAAGVLSWVITIPAIATMLTTLFVGWRKVTLIGAALVSLLVVVALLYSALDSPPTFDESATVTLPPVDPYPTLEGSLNVYVDQVSDAWNEVDGPPRITKGLTRNNEVGEYDTFLYRFGTWGRLAGAYDPDNEALYALMAAGQFSGSGTQEMYIGLCFLTAPYSQECLEAYQTEGLGDGELSDFVDVEHNAEWMVGENRWTLETGGNVLTLRVFAPDAS